VFRRTGALARLAYTLFRESQTLLAHRTDTVNARKRLKEAYGLADRMGAQSLRRQILRFAESHELLPRAAVPAFSDLTPRQMEVLRLVADGLTDREIAETLTISTRTANSHVAKILERLGARNRSEAATRYHQTRHTIQRAVIDLALPEAGI
jgi:DNA-binding NarL/FixJ family response regulator